MSLHLGVVGLGTMGANLARNAARNTAKVVVYNRTSERTDEFMTEFSGEGDFTAAYTYKELVDALPAPRAILLMVKAGPAVDAVIDDVLPLLSKGDILIDAGNSHYKDTERRCARLHEEQVHFVGMGVSGGEEGALHGPSMMPGGDEAAYKVVESLCTAMAADDGEGGKCIAFMGNGGAGHFVKMVHNGIEYGFMQILAEAYHLLQHGCEMSNKEIADVFTAWSKDKALSSFLIEISAEIFQKKDSETNQDLIDLIRDAAGQKGTGKWTTEAALHYGVSVPTITAAVDARIISSGKEFRLAQSTKDSIHKVVSSTKISEEDIRIAVELSLLNVFAQGFQLLNEAEKEEQWGLQLSEIIRTWQGGCIIRAALLPTYRKAFAGNEDARVLLQKKFETEQQHAWRNVIAFGALQGIPLPAMQSALSYYDAYRTARLPQNLIQAQRDFFGAHTYERLDKEGSFHTEW